MGSTPLPTPPSPVKNLSPIGPAIVRSTKSKPKEASNYLYQNQDKGILGRARTEGREIKQLVQNAPIGFASLFGGLAIDVGEIVLESLTELAPGIPDYQAPDPGNTTYGHLGKSFWKSTYGMVSGQRPREYLEAWREGRPLTGMIIEDAGNLSIVGGWTSKALGKAATAVGESATVAGTKAATGFAGETAAEAAARSAKYTNKARRLTSVSQRLKSTSETIKKGKHFADQAMMAPLKPWIWGYKGISQVARTGNLSIDVTPNLTIGTDFRFWGENAAKKYQKQLDDLRTAEPDIDATDIRYSQLLKQISFHQKISQLHGIRALQRRAVRTANHEASLMTNAMEEVRNNPLLKDEINPETGEVWGPLTDIENQAVIAALNGRAQLVSELSRNDAIAPGDVADFGRFDYSEGYSLTPEGAQLAVEYINAHSDGLTPSHPYVTKPMAPDHYARISHAVDQIARTMIELSNKATEGYGRKSPLDANYFTPVPFANKLKDALRRSGVKTKSGTSYYDIFVMLEERGYFDLPVDNQQRMNTLAAFVRALPDEYALDSSMYPASMRENIEFFKRYRRTLRQRLVGLGEGEPMPPTDQPPVGPDEYRMTAKKGAPGSVERLIGRTDKAIDKILVKVDKVTAKIKVIEKKYKKQAEQLQRYDLVEDFIAGREPKYLARKYMIPIAKVREILDTSPMVKQFKRIQIIEAEMAELQKIIGKTRAAMPLDQLETVEMQKLQANYEQLVSEAQLLTQRISELKEINETVRTIEEENVSRAAEELSNLDDELGDLEQELIDAGGDPDQFITKEDITDPVVMPMTPGQTKAFFESVINHIDNEISDYVNENMPQFAADLQRSKTLLIDMWNRAEKGFFEAEGEWLSHAASMRMMQIGKLYLDTEIALSRALDGQTATQIILDILTDKDTLDIISGVKKPEGLQLPRTAAAERRVTIFEKTDLSEDGDTYNIDTLYEDLKDPSVVADLFGASVFGNTARMAEGASQLVRWIKEVQDANPKDRINLILNPPKYVEPAMARKLLQGMTRKAKDIPKAGVTHPLNVFKRRVIPELESVVRELKYIEEFYKTYGENPIYVDWLRQRDDFVDREKTFSVVRGGEGFVVIEVLRNFDIDASVIPKLEFSSNTPVQVVSKAIDALILAIKGDAGSQNIFVDDYNPGWFNGYDVRLTGLTKKLSRHKDRAIKELELIKENINKKAKPVSDEYFLRKKTEWGGPRLAGVSVIKAGELLSNEQYAELVDLTSTLIPQIQEMYFDVVENNANWGAPEQLRLEGEIMTRFSMMLESQTYKGNVTPFDQQVFEFYNSLNRQERQLFFDSLSQFRDYITDGPRTKQNTAALRAVDNIVEFLTSSKFKGDKESRLSIPEQSIEESQRLATGAITTRFKKLNEKSDFVIIPCGNAKLGTAAPASEFYTGSMFQDALRTARKLYTDDRIYVLSAKHGLVTLDQVLEPYDLKLGDEGSINANALAKSMDKLGIEGTVVSLLPKMYDKLFTEAAAGKLDIDHYFEGSRGIGDQKARLSQLRDTAPETIEAPDIPKNMEGSIELDPELEQVAAILANDPDSFQEFRESYGKAEELIKSIEEVRNPTPKDLEDFKTIYTERLQVDSDAIKGYMEDVLGGSWDPATNKVTFYLTPKKGQPEWEWWFRLDASERRYIALNHFSSAEVYNTAAKGSRYVRIGGAIDELADNAGMSVDEFGDALVENVRQLRTANKQLSEAKRTKVEDYKEIYVDENIGEMDSDAWKFAEEYGLSIEETVAVIDRVNFLTQRDVTPGDIPYKLRDIADSPEQVEYDMRIRNVNVRDAAYEVDLIDSMAKEAAKKMKAAERFTERIQALQEFIDKSKIHNARVEKLIKQRAAVEKLRLKQVARGEKLDELKAERKDLKKQATKLRNVIKKVKTDEDFTRLTGSTGSLPLRIALDPNIGYPSAGRSVQFPDGSEVQLTGPMYVPTGRPAPITGGIRTEVIKEGSPGYQRASSEYYRDGDRHTIFSIRLLAKRIESDVRRMANSEGFKAIVAQFGNKPLEVLGEKKIQELQKLAEETALNYPTDRLYAGFDRIVQEAIDAGEPLTDGIAAYAPGVKDPILALKFATQEIFGQLLVKEMQARGLKPIDPYKSITATMRVSSVTDQTMFVPDYLRESIAQMEVIIDPTQWGSIVKGMNKLTSKFKTGTLVLSISWQLGDLLTNILIPVMTEEPLGDVLRAMRMVKKIEYGEGLQGLKNIFDPRGQKPVNLTPEEYAKVRIAEESPVQDISMHTAQRRSLEGLKPLEEKPSKLVRVTKGKVNYPEVLQGRSAVKTVFKLNESINRITRHAFFFVKLEKLLIEKGTSLDALAETNGTWRFDPELRKAVEDAADTANKWLGDFSDLTMWERKYIVGQVPFYAWIKHVHKVFVALGKEHPQSLAWYIYMGNFMFDPNDDPLGLRYGGINFFGGVSSVNTFTPFADVVGGPVGALLLENDMRPALNALGPVARLAGGLGAGFDVTKLEKLQRPAGTGAFTETGIASGGSLLPVFKGGSVTQSLGFTLNQFPIAKRTLQVLPGRTLPGTDIALGPVNTYLTGEARLNPTTRQRVEKWGGTPAAVARLFSVPLVPFKTDEQIRQATVSAQMRLASVAVQKRLREAMKSP